MAIYLRNEVMKALEEERKFFDMGSDNFYNAKKLLGLYKECNYAIPFIKTYIDKINKKQRKR